MTMTPHEFEEKVGEAIKKLSGEELLNRVGQLVLAAAMKKTRVRTGNLRRSENYRVEGKQVFIGTAVDYARFQKEPFLELGLEDAQGDIQTELKKFGTAVLEVIK